MQVATRRLIAATERLDPAGRALLNLWMHRGLSDERIARLTNVTEARVAERRQSLVAALADELGLPPAEVRAAIDRLATPAESGGSADPSPVESDRGRGERPVDGPPLATRSKRFRHFRALAGALIVALLVVVIVVTSTGGTNRAAPGHSAASASPAPSPARALTALPGEAPATGTARLLGLPPHVRLQLSVRGLPPPGPGHYELWLYNSIIDAVPLASFPHGNATLSVALPADRTRYADLDISLQPPGPNPNHSGQSVLRAPLATLGR